MSGHGQAEYLFWAFVAVGEEGKRAEGSGSVSSRGLRKLGSVLSSQGEDHGRKKTP